MSHPRRRRRARRVSDATDYDRSADKAPFVSAFGTDGQRLVVFDSDSFDSDIESDAGAEQAAMERFYREQRPPHYGQ